MEKLACSRGKSIFNMKDVSEHCMGYCSHEVLCKCLKEARQKIEEGRPDVVVLEPSIFYVGFDNTGVA